MTRQALFTQAGITATRTIGELLDTAALLHAQPLPGPGPGRRRHQRGRRGVLAADACAEAGLTLPTLPADLVDRAARPCCPTGRAATNPVDATAAVDGARNCAAASTGCCGTGPSTPCWSALVPTAVAVATGTTRSAPSLDAPGREEDPGRRRRDQPGGTGPVPHRYRRRPPPRLRRLQCRRPGLRARAGPGAVAGGADRPRCPGRRHRPGGGPAARRRVPRRPPGRRLARPGRNAPSSWNTTGFRSPPPSGPRTNTPRSSPRSRCAGSATTARSR